MHQQVLETDLRTASKGADECRLQVVALFEATLHISGIGWRLTTPTGAQPIRTETRRFGRTLLFSELAALRHGLEEARANRCERLTVELPNPLLVSLLQGVPHPKLRRAELAVRQVRPLLDRFSSVRWETERPIDPELSHEVGEALDAGLHAAAERAEHRAEVMEQIIERSKVVRLEFRGGGWVANGRYRVQLDPIRCECPAWNVRWARIPLPGRRAQRLPCKHLVALAIRQGLTVPADLARLAQRAPP